MATSVSRINVTVGANTSQLTTGMQQAAASVRGFSGSAANAQFAIQQLVFAADDAIVSFGTGGFSGAVRGASNNVSAFAASLFGVKGLMVAVAISAAAQLVAALTKTRSEAKGAADAIDELTQSEIKALDAANKLAAIRAKGFIPLGDKRTSGQATASAFSADEDVRNARRELEAARAAKRAFQLANPTGINLLTGERPSSERIKEINDVVELFNKRIERHKEALRLAEAERKVQSELARVLREQEEIKRRANTAPDVPGDRFGFFSGGGAAAGLQAQLKAGSVRNSFDPFRFFGSLPSANAFGSSGAISAINQAQIGPKNVQDAQLRELQDIKRSSADIARSLGGKLPIAVEVPL